MSGPAEADNAARRMAEAAAWRMHLADIGADSTPGFESWLMADPANEAAWEQVDGVWDVFGADTTAPELIAMRHAALRDVKRFRRLSWPRAIGFGAGGAVAAGLAILATIAWFARPDVYSTEIGERRVVTLADNSRISLDSGSEVRVRYTARARDLELVRGQARFEVAHNLKRPFSVHAGDETVIATGTNFDVDMPQSQILVTLVNGHVEVAGPKRTVDLDPGEQLAVSSAGVPTIGHVDVSRIVAWESGRLVFDNEPLASVVARVSRYSATPVVVADAKAGALAISGVFNTGDVDGFVDTITRYLPVVATMGDDGKIRLRSRQ